VKAISSCEREDFLWIQHEYGIFGPNDGSAVLDLTGEAPIPVAVTLHTVPGEPTGRQQSIIESLCADARWVVVMSGAARERLLSYDIDPSRVRVVPHGAALIPADMRHPPDRPTILNWGLIGPGKGLEWGIEAMAHLRHLDPPPLLLIEGVTHPNVLRREGEAYRAHLTRLIADLGVEDMVEIDSGYLRPDALIDLMRRAQLVLLPYDSTDQVTSGVLVEAIGAGIPVIATAFPHAVELLSRGAGAVVPHRNPAAIASAVEHLLSTPDALRHARARAQQVAHGLAWPRVAIEYMRLAREIADSGAANVA
jgi:glycosyltransferase involved in cell wall biosynthesis